jgi:hypothetical protein
MKTRTDLIVATLRLLQADGGIGQMPEAENVDDIDRIMDGVLDEMNEIEAYGVTDYSEFEDKYVDPLATIIAYTANPSYGAARSEDSRDAAIRRLRALKPSTYVSGSTLQVDYF